MELPLPEHPEPPVLVHDGRGQASELGDEHASVLRHCTVLREPLESHQLDVPVPAHRLGGEPTETGGGCGFRD